MLAIQSKLLLQNLLAWQLYFTLLTEKRRCVKPFLGTHTSSLPVCLNTKTSWDGLFCALTVLAHRCHNCIYFWWVVQKKKKIQLHKDNSSILLQCKRIWSSSFIHPALVEAFLSVLFSDDDYIKRDSPWFIRLPDTHSGLCQICLDKHYCMHLLL